MADETEQFDVHREIFELLLSKVTDDRYPSMTMLDIIEQLMTPDEVPAYAQMLLEKVRADTFPSIPMIRRLRNLA